MRQCPDCQVEIKGWELFCPRCSRAVYGVEKPRKVKERKWRLFW